MKKKVFLFLMIIALVFLAFGYTVQAQPGNKNPRYILQATFPHAPSQITVYRTVKPNSAGVEVLKENLSIRTPFENHNGLLVTKDSGRELQYFENGGGLIYVQPEKYFSRKNVNLPTNEQAITIADNFLQSKGFLPSTGKAIYHNIAQSEFGKIERFTNKVTKFITRLEISYDFQVGGIPVIGPGAKMQVAVGENGEVVGVFRAWRELIPDHSAEIITPQEAYDKLRARPGNLIKTGVRNLKEHRIEKVFLGYFIEPGPEVQDEIQPFYVFQGKEIGDTVGQYYQIIPAVKGVELPVLPEIYTPRPRQN